MAIIVNGVEINEAQIESELAQHAEAESPRDAAIQELILRELLLQTAKQQGVTAPTTEEIIGRIAIKETTKWIANDRRNYRYFA